MWKGTVRSLIEVLSRRLPGGIQEIHKKSPLEQLVPWPIFESTRIQIYNFTAILTCSVAVIGYSVWFTPLHYYLMFRQFAIIPNAILWTFLMFCELRNVQFLFRKELPNPLFLMISVTKMAEYLLHTVHNYFISPPLKINIHHLGSWKDALNQPRSNKYNLLRVSASYAFHLPYLWLSKV